MGTGYEIGPRLKKVQNLVPYYVTNAGPSTPFWAVPQQPQVAANQTLSGGNTIGQEVSPENTVGLFAGIDAATNALSIWRADTGAKLTETGTALGTSSLDAVWSWDYWPSQDLIFATQRQTNKMKKFNPVTLSMSDYTATGFTGVARCLKVHNDRLFLAQPSVAPGVIGKTLVSYTDVDVPGNVRAFSVYNVPDNVHAMAETSPSGLDVGARANLIFMGYKSIWALDGVPQAGNDIVRQVSAFGVCENCWAETELGLVFIDQRAENVWLLQRGGTQPDRIGDQVRNLLTASAATRMYWRPPYLTIYLAGSSNNVLKLDFSDYKNPKWFGPHVFPVNKTFGGFDVFAQKAASADKVHLLQTPSIATDRGNTILETGYIFDPDHDVQCQRVIFEFLRSGSNFTPTVKWFKDDIQVDTINFTVPSGTDFYQVVLTNRVRGRNFNIRLELNNVVGLENVRNWLVEYRTIPRQY